MADDAIEHMFDTGVMEVAVESHGVEGPTSRIQVLRERMRRMQQRPDLGIRTLPTLAGVGSLLPGGALRPGASYAVEGSIGLVMALMAGPVAAGAWAGVVGVPEFGAEAAAAMGVELSRVALIPRPGDQWVSVTAALVDALGVVVVRPPARVADSVASRLSARLRQRDGLLIACGDWPQAEARLIVAGGGWIGLGAGSGHLRGRRVAVQVRDRSGRVRERGVELPVTGQGLQPAAATQSVTAVQPAAANATAARSHSAGEAMPRLTRVS